MFDSFKRIKSASSDEAQKKLTDSQKQAIALNKWCVCGGGCLLPRLPWSRCVHVPFVQCYLFGFNVFVGVCLCMRMYAHVCVCMYVCVCVCALSLSPPSLLLIFANKSDEAEQAVDSFKVCMHAAGVGIERFQLQTATY